MAPAFEIGGRVGSALVGLLELVAADGTADVIVDGMSGEVLKLEIEEGTFDLIIDGTSGEVLALVLGEAMPDGIDDGVLGGTEGVFIGALDGANVKAVDTISFASKARNPSSPPCIATDRTVSSAPATDES